jgi:hypothetical protein
MRRVLVLILAVAAVASIDLVADGGAAHAGHGESSLLVRAALAQVTTFLQTFNGTPPAPQPWAPTDWDVQVNVSDGYQSDGLAIDTMQAHHGAGCGAPPATHTISRIEDTVFICNDHVMTSMSAGYGAIYLTPNALVDFSGGEAVVTFDLSTFRTVGRDWVDVWVTPFEDNLVLPLEDWGPAYQGEPRRGISMRMDGGTAGGTIFRGIDVRNFVASDMPPADWRNYELLFAPSASRRDTFELRISRTHVKFGMPAYNLWWVNRDVADLGWSRGVVQFAHHAYNPTKGCDEDGNTVDEEGACANTWHWDNVRISPAAPFTILRGSPRRLTEATTQQVTFPAPAPAGSFLRFAGVGDNLEVSFNGGRTWEPARRQAQELNRTEHWSSYWTPVPTGTTGVRFRGHSTWAGPWAAQDLALWSTTTSSNSVPTPTPAPPASCAARPPVTLSSVKSGSGALQVTVRTTTSSTMPSNAIREVRFRAPSNARIDAGGQVGRTDNFTVALATSTPQFTFTVRRAAPGAATTVPFTVVDACGEWTTFVGGGPHAF